MLEKLSVLEGAAYCFDDDAVQDALFDLGGIANGYDRIPDVVCEKILDLLRSGAFLESSVSAHLLNFFQFECSRLTSSQKLKLSSLLDDMGMSFKGVHVEQVICELRNLLNRSSDFTGDNP